LNDRLFAFLEDATDRGLIEDATVASSTAQAQALWALRENISEAQKHFGGSIKHDVSVPIASVPPSSPRSSRRSRRRFPAPGCAPSAISATATSIATSINRWEPTRRRSSPAGTR
jgi:4-phosphoerythronate dehydrogenase (FAD-dependent)